MARPAKKTEYRLMTLSELREEANRRLYQANKLRAEYEVKARRKADEAAAWARRTGADIETGARRVQHQVERAGLWTKSVEDDVRRRVATGARYADEAVDAVSAAPGRAFEAIVDRRDDEIRDGRKYFLGSDPYRKAMLYRAHGVTDPNSAEAKAVEAAERDYLQQFYDKFHAEWDGEPDWKKPFLAFHYGAEKGGFGDAWAAARTLKRQDSWSDEGYQAELLPYTFAAEDHPVAYMAGEAAGGTARAMALRS